MLLRLILRDMFVCKGEIVEYWKQGQKVVVGKKWVSGCMIISWSFSDRRRWNPVVPDASNVTSNTEWRRPDSGRCTTQVDVLSFLTCQTLHVRRKDETLRQWHDRRRDRDGGTFRLQTLICFFVGSFKSQLIDYFRGHIVSWEAFGRFMLTRTKWHFWTSWRPFGCTLWRSQLLCSWRNFYFYSHWTLQFFSDPLNGGGGATSSGLDPLLWNPLDLPLY